MKMSKFVKTTGIVILTLVMLVSLIPTTQVNAATVRLNKKEATILAGSTVQLKLSGTKKSPVWKSGNKKVAKVSKKGLVTGISEGTTKITAKLKGKKYICKITVKASGVMVPDGAGCFQLKGNPTTGYSWKVDSCEQGAVIVSQLAFVQDPAEEDMTGVGGTYYFAVAALGGTAPGEYAIHMKYLKIWEGDSSITTTAVITAVVHKDGTVTCKTPVITR